MHIIQVVRNYLELSKKELAQQAGITQPDLCEMETKEPYPVCKWHRFINDPGDFGHAQLTTTIMYTHKISDRKSVALVQMGNLMMPNTPGEKGEERK